MKRTEDFRFLLVEQFGYGDPSVGALHTTNGRWDIVAELRTDSLASFDHVLRRIGQVEGVARTETSLLLSTFK